VKIRNGARYLTFEIEWSLVQIWIDIIKIPHFRFYTELGWNIIPHPTVRHMCRVSYIFAKVIYKH